MSTENDDVLKNDIKGFVIEFEEGSQTDGVILFYAISGLITWILCCIFAWIISGFMTRNKKRLSISLILTTMGVILGSSLNGFIIFIFKTNAFISDAESVMEYQCAPSVHFTSLCYGLYRYSLYIFYLIRIRIFFRGTAHEFRKQKCIAAFVVISIISLCLITVLVLYITPRIITNDTYTICSGELNDELRSEILVFLVIDVFVSLYLTWLFVIKSRALLALENANQNALDEDEEEEEEADDHERMPLTNRNYGVDHERMPTTYFIDEENGGLNSKSVRKLMLRCIYFGMLAMMTTWLHLALRFVNIINIVCIETLVNSVCVMLSFDITSEGWCNMFCWCTADMGHNHGYGRNVRSNKERKAQNDNKLVTVVPTGNNIGP